MLQTNKLKYAEDAAGLGRLRAIGMSLPALILLVMFVLFPALWTLFLGMTNYQLTSSSMNFVGLSNYMTMLKDPLFYNAILMSLLFVGFSAILGQSILGFLVAWYLRSIPKSIVSIIEALIIAAWVAPGSVTVFIWLSMYRKDGGMINTIFGTTTNWLVHYPMLSVIVFNIWVGVAFSVLQYRSALASVPENELESARLMGATKSRTIKDVVLPHIKGHVMSNVLLVCLSTLSTFSPYMLTMGGPNHKSEVLPAYIYNTALGNGELGRGSAISVALIFLNLMLFLIMRRVGGKNK